VIVEEQDDPNKVQWNEDDPENPQNWTARYKWFITILCGVLTINVTFASTAPASATEAIAIAFGTTIEISTLATSLFLFGYCVGPLLWAPLSEMFGRRPVFIYTMFIYTLFQIPGAVAANITTVLVSRFLAGVFAAAPLTNCGGVIADIWDSIGRGPAMSVFTLCVFVGPTVLGPTIGGYLTMSYLGWRWVFWIMGIFALLCWSLVVAFLPETYAPVCESSPRSFPRSNGLMLWDSAGEASEEDEGRAAREERSCLCGARASRLLVRRPPLPSRCILTLIVQFQEHRDSNTPPTIHHARQGTHLGSHHPLPLRHLRTPLRPFLRLPSHLGGCLWTEELQ
jgi:multidrug resistance protein